MSAGPNPCLGTTKTKLSLISACLYYIKHFFNIHLMKARLLLITTQVFCDSIIENTLM